MAKYKNKNIKIGGENIYRSGKLSGNKLGKRDKGASRPGDVGLGGESPENRESTPKIGRVNRPAGLHHRTSNG